MSNLADTFLDAGSVMDDPQTKAEYTAFCLAKDLDDLAAMARNPATRRHVFAQRTELREAYQKTAEILNDLDE